MWRHAGLKRSVTCKKECSMQRLTSRLCFLAFAVGALAAQGCRHTQKVAGPAVVPSSTNASSMPETKVTPPSDEFKSPATPVVQADRTENNGAIRDAFF